MLSEHVVTIYFSPTGTSEKIGLSIEKGLNSNEQEVINLTEGNTGARTFTTDETVIFSVPVYAGRVAPPALERMEGFKAEDTPAIAVVVYGNREFEDALLELKNVLTEKGFNVVAAAAFIGEHSFSTDVTPVAPGRPDQQDIEKAEAFGKALRSRESGAQAELSIPGNFPYKDGIQSNPLSPQVIQEKCVLCKTCETVCPVGAVAVDQKVAFTGSLCIFCCACIKNCPEGALAVTAAPILEKAQWLAANYSARKEPELFF